MQKSPILVVDDDADDIEFLTEIFKESQIKNPVLYFRNGEALLAHLKSTNDIPLLILSDLNMPGLNGFDIKERLKNENSQHKSAPFIFLTTSDSPPHVNKAYELCTQGFFVKPNDMQVFAKTIKAVVDYWELSRFPRR